MPTRLLPTSIACLTTPSLAFQCELAERPGLADTPAALTDMARERVTEVTRAAWVRGVRVGDTLRAATAICPMLTLVRPRPALIARYADWLIEAMCAVSPVVEEEEQGVVFADLHGTEGLYPTLEDLRLAVFRDLPPTLLPQLGVARVRFTAQAAALRAAPGTAVEVTQGEAAFLAEEPLLRLPLEIEARERLHLLGITTCGDLAALPRDAVEAQFGPAGGIAWLAAIGNDPRPLHPRPWEHNQIVEHVQAEPPLVSREMVLHAFEQMLGRALRQPGARHRFVRIIRLRAETEQGELWQREQILREPLSDRNRLWTLLRSLIEYADFPGPFALVSLELGALTQESGRQQSLFTEQTRRREQLDEMVRHLKVRFGDSPLARIVDVEPWHRLPEHRHALLEYDP